MPGLLADLGCQRPMVVASARAMATRQGRAVTSCMISGNLPALFDRVHQHPSMALAVEGAQAACAYGADSIIAIGGGSAIDLAKGVALAARGSDLERLADTSPAQRTSDAGLALPPIIAIPTTLSGAEAIPRTGLLDARGHKRILRHPQIACRAIILDAMGNQETPAMVMLPSGMNAFAHCLEALYSRARDPVSTALALAALPWLHRGLDGIMAADSRDARAQALVGAFLAGRAIINARTGLHHATCHVLGARGLSHGLANAVVLPHALRFNARASGGLLDGAAAALGLEVGSTAAEALAELVERIRLRAGLPGRLRDVGIGRDQFADIAAQVTLEPGMAFNPGQALKRGDLVAFLEGCY